MVDPLRNEHNATGRPQNRVPVMVAEKSRAGGVALLGIVVRATTFVARLAIIAILPAMRFMEDLTRGSLREYRLFTTNNR
ncbi:MAG: hypothetical protein ABL860_04435 [Candidatus Nitrotoga sp.]